MKTLKPGIWLTSIACLVAAIPLLAEHTTSAQITIVPVTFKELPNHRTTTWASPHTSTACRNGDSLDPQSDARLEILLEEINKRKKEVETFNPAERSQLVTMSTPELFLPAISARARAAYYKRDHLNERQQAALNPALDSLAAAAAKKLALFKPDGSLFAFRNPTAELMMKQSLKNGAAVKVNRSGIKESVWLIEKNEVGIPLDRYKHGYIWARDNSDDHPYCHLYTIHLIQNYAGGGTYGALFARLSDDVIVGCP